MKGVTIEDDMEAMGDATQGMIAACIFEEMLKEGQEWWAGSFESFCSYLLWAQDSWFEIDLTCVSPAALQEEREEIKKGIQRTGGGISEICYDNKYQIEEYNKKVERMGHSELKITKKDVEDWIRESRLVR